VPTRRGGGAWSKEHSGQVRSRLGAELFEGVGLVEANRADGELEVLGDLLMTASQQEQLDHLELARREPDPLEALVAAKGGDRVQAGLAQLPTPQLRPFTAHERNHITNLHYPHKGTLTRERDTV